MSSNINLGQSRDQLMQQMLSLANESNYYTMLEQTLKQIIECKTLSPYLYLHRKTSLRSKFDNTKASQYICQLAIYLSSVSPLMLPKQTITNKLMSLCIDKFNHMKIKSNYLCQFNKEFETNQFMNFLLIDLGEKQKAQFIKLVNEQKMDNENIPVMAFANIMYWTIVYLWAVKELAELAGKLKNLGVGGSNGGDNFVSCQVFNQYLAHVDEEDSVLKMLHFEEIKEGENILEKVMSRIFFFFDGEEIKDSVKN